MNDIRFEATGSFDLVSVDQTGSGDIRLEAAGSLTVLASGAGVSTDGGTVFFTTGGSLFLNHDVTTEGGSLFAFVDGQITSSAGTSVNTSPSAGGTNSGSVSLFAQGAVDLSGDINTSGAGAGDRSGNAFVSSSGDAVVVNNIDATEGTGATPRSVEIDAVGDITLNGVVAAGSGSVAIATTAGGHRRWFKRFLDRYRRIGSRPVCCDRNRGRASW